MSMLRRPVQILSLLCAASSCLCLAGQYAFEGHEIPKNWNHMNCDQRIETLHAGFQKAMNDLTRTKMIEMTGRDANGKEVKMKVPATFGLRRIATVSVTHNGQIKDTDVPLLFAQTDGVVEYYGASCSGAPLKAKNLTLHSDFGIATSKGSDPTAQKEMLDFAKKALTVLSDKPVYVGRVSGLRAQARTIKLTKPACLPCHPGMKVGDSAALIVYLKRPLPSKAR